MRAPCEIAAEIVDLWPSPHFAAVPYLGALRRLESWSAAVGWDSAKSAGLYFLGNARSWTGPDARRIKAEIKEAVR